MKTQRGKVAKFKFSFRAPASIKPCVVIRPEKGKGSYMRKMEKFRNDWEDT